MSAEEILAQDAQVLVQKLYLDSRISKVPQRDALSKSVFSRAYR